MSTDDDTQRYHCSYCQCDITLRLKCATCPDFDLCLQCFASGAVAGGHKKDHPYQLIDEGSFPLLVENWGAIEEVLLLDAVEQDGFGNWEDIAAHVVTKSARECKDHYSEFYIAGTIGQGVVAANYHTSVLDGHGGEAPPSPPHFTPIKLEHTEQLELGYMPLRDDFEKEYDSEVETLISGLQVGPDEDDLEKALKLAQIDIYNEKLAERHRRKAVSRQHNLIAGKQRQTALKCTFSKDERELRTKYKSLARLIDVEDYEKFVGSIKREKQLRDRVKELMRYRKNGITHMDDCIEFDTIRQEQEKMKENRSDTDTHSRDGSRSPSLGDMDYVLARGLSFLSGTERKLCHSLALKSQEYLTLKTEILRNYALKRSGYPARPKLPKSLTSSQKAKLQQFFTSSGWIN